MNGYEYLKQFSQWHNNPEIRSIEHQNIGNFSSEKWSSLIEKIKSNNKEDANFKNFRNERIHKELSNLEKTIDYETFDNLFYKEFLFDNNLKHHPLIVQIIDFLGLEFDKTKVNTNHQFPGQITPIHFDAMSVDTEIEKKLIYKNPDIIRRFAIALTNWDYGQVFQIGNSNWHQWKIGDCITWNWRDHPHGTANFGRSERITLIITGKTTEKTNAVIQKENQIINLS